MPATITIPEAIQDALDRGAVVALSMSGGKDSQAMAKGVISWLRDHGYTNRVVAVHADLGRAEWHQTHDVVHAQADELGLDLQVVQRTKGDLLQRIQERAEQVGAERPFWPSASSRYCTSDLKRDPIDKLLRTLGPLVISVEGVRAEESRNRAAKPCWEPRKRITTQSREAMTWRPIHHWTEQDVWAYLGGRHGPNVHPAYALGNERLSCSLCVLASQDDLERGARHNPEYLQELVALEERYGWTFTSTTSVVELAQRVAR